MPFIVWQGVPGLGLRFCALHVEARDVSIDVWISEMRRNSKSFIARCHFASRRMRRLWRMRRFTRSFFKYTKELDTIRAD